MGLPDQPLTRQASAQQKRKTLQAQARLQKKQKLSWSREAAASPASVQAPTPGKPAPTQGYAGGVARPNKAVTAAKKSTMGGCNPAQEVEELKRKIAAEQQRIREQQKEAFTQAQLEASRQAKLAQQQQQHQERQHKLVSGFAQLQHGSEKGGSKQERAHLDVADVAVVARVLEAHSDYDTLQLRIGCDAVAVRRRYRELAFALHPDKCKVPGADEAFRKVVKAQENLLKYL